MVSAGLVYIRTVDAREEEEEEEEEGVTYLSFLNLSLQYTSLLILSSLYVFMGTAVAQWLRYCATNHKVTGSIPVGVMEFFIDRNPSDCTMALVSTLPVTEMSTRRISWE
jgi:hypothetical protein